MERPRWGVEEGELPRKVEEGEQSQAEVEGLLRVEGEEQLQAEAVVASGSS